MSDIEGERAQAQGALISVVARHALQMLGEAIPGLGNDREEHQTRDGARVP